jgi:HSP20 family protein
MPGLILWKNQELNKLKRDIDRLFSRIFDEFRVPTAISTSRVLPTIDLEETKDNLLVRADIPGMNPDDIDISVTEDTLRIKGEIRHEATNEGKNYYRSERRYGSFYREITLPCRIKTQEVSATYKNGVLHITLPKCEPEKPKVIRIKVR